MTSGIHDEWSLDEWNDGWSLDEWNDDWSGVGWHEDCEQTYNTSVSSFSLESSEWVNTNLDTGAAVNAFLVNFDREGAGNGSFYDWIPDGESRHFQGFDGNGLPRSLNGRLTDAHQVLGSNASAFSTGQAASDAHKVLCSAAEIACNEQQDFYFGQKGGCMIPIHSKNWSGNEKSF